MFNFDRTDCEIIARRLLSTLEHAESMWRQNSPQWAQKLKDWNVWVSRSKERDRLHDKQKKQKKDPDELDSSVLPESTWHSTFDPDEPSAQFSFVGGHTSYSKSDLDADINDLKWTSTPHWALDCLRRGIAVHHSGMNKRYRSLVER